MLACELLLCHFFFFFYSQVARGIFYNRVLVFERKKEKGTGYNYFLFLFVLWIGKGIWNRAFFLVCYVDGARKVKGGNMYTNDG
ncbi:hypothetical protein BKA61DRAFT_217611 [Leptodontidium sp. MPI-SDFR-AT-0119]|nr:hypothetical protein BKA61DRAFT_217611 [Leptodontidium sp. MPI-SDFR-AT-0119]